jgi:hypothetical protein
MDRLVTHRDGETDRVKPLALASSTGSEADILIEFLPDLIGVGFPVTPFEVWDNSFKGALIMVSPIILFKIEGDRLFSGPFQKDVFDLWGEPLKGCINIKTVMLAKGVEKLMKINGMAIGPRGESPFTEGKGGIGDNKFRVEIAFGTKAAAFRTGPMGVIKRKHLRGQLRNTDPALTAGCLLTEKNILFSGKLNNSLTLRQAKGEFYGIGEATPKPFFDDEPVYDNADRVLLLFVQPYIICKESKLTVYLNACIAIFSKTIKTLGVFPLAVFNKGGKYLNFFAFVQG